MKVLRLLSILASLTVSLVAEPITLTREQAFKLHSALEAIGPGLTPANAIVAADNLNALAPHADAVRKGAVALQRAQARVPDSPDRAERLMRLAEEFDAAADEQLTVELSPLEISADEIREAKIAPAMLATLRRHLRKK
jgi:hypothetical protein